MGITKQDMTINRYQNALSKINNSSFSSFGGGALGEGDRGAFQYIPENTGNPFESQNYVWRWRQYCHLYEISWEARKIIRIPVEDALRKEWEVEDIQEEITKKIQAKLKQLNFLSILKRSLMLERLLGGCLTFLGLESSSDNTEKVYHPQREKARLRFLNAIPISRISRMNWDTDPLSENYMRPHEFVINSNTVHVSRCLVWDGEPLFDPYDFMLTNFRANLSGFGPSKLASIWDDIIKAAGTRQAAFQMIQTNNAIIMAISELQDIAGTNPGKAQLAELKRIANQLSVYKATLIQKDKVDITQNSASFGSVPELIITFLQVLSAASDIPATRFLGQAPGGLNATGESDLENYYNSIDAFQMQRIEPALRRVYDTIGWAEFPTIWGKEREKLTFKFPPLWNINELEEAQKNGVELDNLIKLHDQNMISDGNFIKEINSKKMFSMDLDDTDIGVMESFGDIGPYNDNSNPGDVSGLNEDQQTPKEDDKVNKNKVISLPQASKVETTEQKVKQPVLDQSKREKQIHNAKKFKEEEHPRGNKDNPGEFVKKGQGQSKDSKNKQLKSKDSEKGSEDLTKKKYNKVTIDLKDFSNKDLTESSFTDTNINSTSFKKAILEEVEFSNVEISDCDFTNSNLKDTYFYKNSFTNCDFTNSNLKDAYFSDFSFTNCDFKNSNLKDAYFSDSSFTNCDFTNSNLKDVKFSHCSFTKCDFKNVEISNIDIFNDPLHVNKINLEGALYKGKVISKKQAIAFSNSNLIHKILSKKIFSKNKVKNKKEVQRKLTVDTKLNSSTIVNTIYTWAKTSGDNDREAVKTQLIANTIFNLNAKTNHLGKKLSKNEKEFDTKEFQEKKLILTAQYKQTQKFFKDNDIKELVLYRGMKSSSLKLKSNEIQEVDLQPLSSFSMNFDTARKFGDKIIATKVPVKRVFSTPLTGFGCTEEQEIVLLGDKIKATITKNPLGIFLLDK